MCIRDRERNELLLEVSDKCQSLMEFEGKVADFFDSLKLFVKTFSEPKISMSNARGMYSTVSINEFSNNATELKNMVLKGDADAIKLIPKLKSRLNKSASFKPLATPNKSGVSLCFGSFLNLKTLAKTIKSTESSISIYGLESELGSNEIISFFYELPEDLRKQVAAVTFDHLHFKDLSAFTHTLKQSPCLSSLRLLSCPFAGSDIVYILEKAAECGTGVKELVVEDAELGKECSEAFAVALSRTKISCLKLVGCDVAAFAQSLIKCLNDTLKQVDFGAVKNDLKVVKLLKELTKTKKVIYSIV
eukprot:TRINITY_DN7934_c0_g1_i11.p1 TRINITY_DN7934_c0_g1~~TRINITY_DN7934_c0_g1_i11.p1  ORF type:complete len:304 (+),score=63.58 TRINITY_DN7934_c0_g1_i11:73-984(+)